MSLVNLGLQGFLNKEQSHGEDRFALFSSFLARRLTKVAQVLHDLSLYFEADAAEELARSFERFVEDDGEPEDFAQLWNDLEDWCGTDTEVNGKSRTLCNIGHLPDRFAC
jgi:hypothetical protein